MTTSVMVPFSFYSQMLPIQMHSHSGMLGISAIVLIMMWAIISSPNAFPAFIADQPGVTNQWTCTNLTAFSLDNTSARLYSMQKAIEASAQFRRVGPGLAARSHPSLPSSVSTQSSAQSTNSSKQFAEIEIHQQTDHEQAHSKVQPSLVRAFCIRALDQPPREIPNFGQSF